jgi:hypothetical protein
MNPYRCERRKPFSDGRIAKRDGRPAADDRLTGGINAVDLEDRLGDVETDCRDRLHVGARLNRGGLNAIHALTARGSRPCPAGSMSGLPGGRHHADRLACPLSSSSHTSQCWARAGPNDVAMARMTLDRHPRRKICSARDPRTQSTLGAPHEPRHFRRRRACARSFAAFGETSLRALRFAIRQYG